MTRSTVLTEKHIAEKCVKEGEVEKRGKYDIW
jgi:hypothetical protein